MLQNSRCHGLGQWQWLCPVATNVSNLLIMAGRHSFGLHEAFLIQIIKTLTGQSKGTEHGWCPVRLFDPYSTVCTSCSEPKILLRSVFQNGDSFCGFSEFEHICSIDSRMYINRCPPGGVYLLGILSPSQIPLLWQVCGQVRSHVCRVENSLCSSTEAIRALALFDPIHEWIAQWSDRRNSTCPFRK